MWMTRVAVQNPVFASMVMFALMVLGLFSYNRLRVEQLPDISLPFASIDVPYPGASPEAVEADITKPLEQVLNTLPGVKMIRSNSFEGMSSVFVEFKLSTDGDKAIQGVRDKVSALRPGLPRDVGEPSVTRVDAENNHSLVYMVLLSDKRSLRELSHLAQKTIRQRLERINGVGSINVSGAVERRLEIRLKPEALARTGVSADHVMTALRSMNVNAPVGEIRGRANDAVVRVDGRMRSPREFEELVVLTRQTDRGPITLKLSQVADVVDAERERTEVSRYGGAPGVGISVSKVQDANLVETGDAIVAAAKELQKTLPRDVQLKVWWAASDGVKEGVQNVKTTIVEGALLTIAIVFLFLASWRSTIITGLTLPIAILSTFVALFAFGFSINYLTLMALSLTIGLLIDDAIVVRENISRHIAMGKPAMQAALDGTNEIGLAVIATTLSIVAVFVPIAFMSGVIGKFFFAFGITVAVAVLISLFVSFTLDPMLSAYWKDPSHADGRHAIPNWPIIGGVLRWFDGFMTRSEARYAKLIEWALSHRKTTVAIALASFVGALALFPLIGSEFQPQTDGGFTNVRLQLPPGGTLSYAESKAQRAEELLKGIPEIELLGTEVNRGNINLQIKLVDRAQRKRSQQELENVFRDRLKIIPGVELQVGWNRPIYIALLGNNDVELERQMKLLFEKVSKVRGIVDPETSLKAGTPSVSLRLKPEAAEFGVTHAQLGSLLRTMVSGEQVGTWLAPDGENYALIVRLPEAERASVDQLRSMNITAGRLRADGTPMTVPLEQVATITRGISPEVIKRQDLQRRVAFYAGIKDRSLGEISADIKQITKEMEATLPTGLRFDVGGQQQELDSSFTAALQALGMAVIFLYFILGSQFGSFLQPLAIMASLPLALIGVALALLLTGTTLNIFSMIGVIMLMGLVTKNAILLVDFANRAQREEGLSQAQALIKAGVVRLRPILMTTAAMVFGMMPLALGLGQGSEEQAPMGRAIIGGVITSTLLTLVVVPVLYSWLDRSGARKQKELARADADNSRAVPQVQAAAAE